MPDLTVLMAVRNGEPYLQAAVDSILSQTYGDFAFLIIDDASTDNTREIVRSYDDPRIQLLSLEKNIGQTAALNRGLQETKTEWIARMDADDYSAPKRFELQMKAAKADSTLGCIGTYAWTFTGDPAVVEGKIEKPVGNAAIQAALLWSSPLIHGSMIARTQQMRDAGGYNERYRYSADLDLYDRLLSRCGADNVPEPLLGIRRHRLAAGAYSPKEVAVVRAGKHLHEALCAKVESRYLATAASMVNAFWFSPLLTLKHFLPRSIWTP
jgi:glycosyltransferase involved in cell wall biosynthesis